MAPKNLPPAAKQQKILTYFRTSLSVFTLKELEKSLASVASINQMQVKDYLQALCDENLIRVEKIGSGNWYWCFESDAKRGREGTIEKLRVEEMRLREGIGNTEREIEEEMGMRGESGEEMGEGGDRKALLEIHEGLLREEERLDAELACFVENDPVEVRRKVEEVRRLRESAVRWTDNIESLESFVLKMTGDRAQTAEVMASACGEEYVVGEGLKDL